MRQYNVKKAESGQTAIKYLQRLLINAPSGLIYKQIRNKNIKLNDKKISGNEKINENDIFTIYFSDETLDKFTKNDLFDVSEYVNAYKKYKKPDLIYEDEHILFINKPVNMLSQKAKPNDVSANEWILGYLIENKKIDVNSLSSFKPSVCNRLDRNTGGLLSFGKTLYGTNILNNLFRDRSAHKYYRTVVYGEVSEAGEITGYLSKNSNTNKVYINNIASDDSDYIKTIYRPIRYSENKNITELEVELVTGKSHQIRASLASINHPILGDYKYSNKFKSNIVKGPDHQLLYAVRFEFPDIEDYSEISRKTISINVSDIFDPYF